ncbi:hypothetical protein HDU87_008119 [Geranomyces variabilis]|uniref:Uncharacterized protein n=1 Tax=Geranomyces variabilis TaxID=109894 RepID=A0AAD5XTJ7_9FUNG|nr:hypothetical protein HDU87_008119 [Geranomyces variabilis]
MQSTYVKPKKKKKAFDPSWMYAPQLPPPGYMGDLQCNHCMEKLSRMHYSGAQLRRDYKRACYRCVAQYEGSWADFKNTQLWARTVGPQARDRLSSTAGSRPVSGGWDLPLEGDDERPGVNVPGSAAYNARANGVPAPPSQPIHSATTAQNRPAPANSVPYRQPLAPQAAAAGPSNPAASGSRTNEKQQSSPAANPNSLADTAWPSRPNSVGSAKSRAASGQSAANAKVQSSGTLPKPAANVKPEAPARKASGVVRIDFIKRVVTSATHANASAKAAETAGKSNDTVQSKVISKKNLDSNATTSSKVNLAATAIKSNGVIQTENIEDTNDATKASVEKTPNNVRQVATEAKSKGVIQTKPISKGDAAENTNSNNVDSAETVWKRDGDIQAMPVRKTDVAVKTEPADTTKTSLPSTEARVDSPNEYNKQTSNTETTTPVQPRARYLISIDQLTATSKRTALAQSATKLRLGLILYTGSRGFAMVEGDVENVETFLTELAAIKKSSSVRVKKLIPDDRKAERRKIVDDAGQPSCQEVRTLEEFVNRLKAADLITLWNEHLACGKA